MKTIKKIGLKKIITQKEFSEPTFQLHRILTSDLTSTEITDSLRVAQEILVPLSEFINQYDVLSAQVAELKKQLSDNKQGIEKMRKRTGLFPLLCWVGGLGIILTIAPKKDIPICIALLGLGCVAGWIYLLALAAKKAEKLVIEQDSLSHKISLYEKQIGQLRGAKLLKNAAFGVSTLSAMIIRKRLINLETVLQKMLILVNDTEGTGGNSLLAMENYLRLLKNKRSNHDYLSKLSGLTF